MMLWSFFHLSLFDLASSTSGFFYATSKAMVTENTSVNKLHMPLPSESREIEQEKGKLQENVK